MALFSFRYNNVSKKYLHSHNVVDRIETFFNEKFSNDLMNMEEESVTNGACKYELYDSDAVMRKLNYLCNTWNKNQSIPEKIWRIQNVREYFNTKNELFDDMLFLCYVYVMRGTAFTRIVDTTSGQAKEILIHLGKKYQIVGLPSIYQKEADMNPDTDAITLERIVKCYPDVCCQFYADDIYTSIFDEYEDVIGLNLKPIQFRLLFCPLAPTVICAELLQRRTNVIPFLLWFAFLNEITIVEGRICIAHLWQVLKHNIGLHVIPEEMKRYNCRKWGLLTETGELSQFLKYLRPVCVNVLKDRFKKFKALPQILNEIEFFHKESSSAGYCENCYYRRDDLTYAVCVPSDKV